MSIPVGFVLFGFFVSNLSVTISSADILVDEPTETGNVPIVRYVFLESPARYILFIGMIIFFGNLVPDLFQLFRNKLQEKADSIKITDSPSPRD